MQTFLDIPDLFCLLYLIQHSDFPRMLKLKAFNYILKFSAWKIAFPCYITVIQITVLAISLNY